MKKFLLKNAMVICAALLGFTLQAQVAQPTKVYNPSGKQHPSMSFAASNGLTDEIGRAHV